MTGRSLSGISGGSEHLMTWVRERDLRHAAVLADRRSDRVEYKAVPLCLDSRLKFIHAGFWSV